MSVHRGDTELADLSHEMLSVDPLPADRDYDVTQHIVTDVAPGHELDARTRRAWGLRRRPLSHHAVPSGPTGRRTVTRQRSPEILSNGTPKCQFEP